MHTSRRPHTGGKTSSRRSWITRRRTAALSSALRGAAYATGAGIVGIAFFLIEQQL
ncbi:hypothetical protein AB4225_29415 [Streptomyces sp. 2RAF24]|uniref:hypothetical protein n=1 Tax=Streptomyces sp. 2RAF24 TaxID=3232997 RepID=UPI003F96CB2C